MDQDVQPIGAVVAAGVLGVALGLTLILTFFNLFLSRRRMDAAARAPIYVREVAQTSEWQDPEIPHWRLSPDGGELTAVQIPETPERVHTRTVRRVLSFAHYGLPTGPKYGNLNTGHAMTNGLDGESEGGPPASFPCYGPGPSSSGIAYLLLGADKPTTDGHSAVTHTPPPRYVVVNVP